MNSCQTAVFQNLSTLCIQSFLRNFSHRRKPKHRLRRSTIRSAHVVRKIDHPGTGNKSQFYFAETGLCAKIVETRNNVTTDTKLFVWCKARSEERDASGNVTKQFFSLGEKRSGTVYFYSLDHLGSIREVTDSSGVSQSQISYDPFGRITSATGAISPDFLFAGFYRHAPSDLYLTAHRQYSEKIGRWLSQDPIGEPSNLNLYGYANNSPLNFVDPYGLISKECCYGSAKTPGARRKLVHQALVAAADNALSIFNASSRSMGLTLTAIAMGESPFQDDPLLIGNIVDKIFKDQVRQSQCLSILVVIVNRGQSGPDVYSEDLDIWWDLTTKKQADSNRHKVYPEYGTFGIFLPYYIQKTVK